MILSQLSVSNHPTIDAVKQLLGQELCAVDRLIASHLYSDIPLIEEISDHILSSGGKRLRPLVVLLAAKAMGYEGEEHIALAAVVEFIHTATLLHDDVVDNSSMRRGQDTANVIWGNSASILVGDFLYSRTFQILTHLKNMEVMNVLAETTNAIAEGEVLQLVKRNDPSADEAHYLAVICNKTARLFQAAAEVAAMISQRDVQECQLMANYGRHLGMAFQLVDDVLDYMGDSEELGKNIGDDLAEGKPTLPLIHALTYASPEKAEIIKESIRSGGLVNLEGVMNAITEADSLQYTLNKAKNHIDCAINSLCFLPESPFKQGLTAIAAFSVERKY